MKRRRNAPWKSGRYTVDVDEYIDPWSGKRQFKYLVTDSKGKRVAEEAQFDKHDQALKEGLDVVAAQTRPIGILGDVSPVEHGGGILYHDPTDDTYRVIYFEPYVSGRREEMINVYAFGIAGPGDVLDDLSWVDWDSIASSSGISVEDLKAAADSKDPMVRARLYEEVGQIDGFLNLDAYPSEGNVGTAADHWDDDIEDAHKAERKTRRPNRRRKPKGKPKPNKARRAAAIRRRFMRL